MGEVFEPVLPGFNQELKKKMDLVFSVLLCVVMAYVIVQISTGYSRLDLLESITVENPDNYPLVSVIIPACNEESAIATTLEKLEQLHYENLEIIVVDDRSTDATAEIISSLSSAKANVTMVQISQLPEGWLGKTHALQEGAHRASGEYLLFMDADVWLEASVLSRAIRAMELKRLDHLTLIFKNSSPGILLNSLIADIGAGLFFMVKPWRVRRPKSRYYMGVGAFNLVKKSVYRAIGEHEKMRLQVIDDVYLGKLVKQNGFRQDCMLADSLVTLHWYTSTAELIDGLMKNVYAFFHYRLGYAVVGVLAIFLVAVFPMYGAFFIEGPARWFFLLAVLIRIGGIGGGMVQIGIPPISILFLLITPFISLYIIIKAVMSVHIAGGVRWRESFYSLQKLRQTDWVLSGILWPQKRGR